MQSIIIIFIGIALFLSVILSNFLVFADKRRGNDFSFKYYVKNFKLSNCDLKYVFIFVLIFEVLYGFIPMPNFIIYIPLILALILAFSLDAKYMILPDTASIIIAICGVINLILNFSIDNLISSILGMAIGGVTLYVINWIFETLTKQVGFGFGDVKLLASLGLFFGLKNIAIIMVMSVFLSAAFSIVYLVVNWLRKKKEVYLPFGPFIVISTLIICIIPGDKIISTYFNVIDYFVAMLI